MPMINYNEAGVTFECSTTEISAVVGSEALSKVFHDVIENRLTHLSGISCGAISSESSENSLLTLGDVISKQFKVHKKVSRKRSIQAVEEILQFLQSDNIVDVPFRELSEMQLAHARLAQAISLRPEMVISWTYLSKLSAPVRVKISRNIVNIHNELHIGFLLLEKRLQVVQGVAQHIVNLHPINAPVSRPNPPITPTRPTVTKSSPDEISGLDFVSS